MKNAEELHNALLQAWNDRDAKAFAALFAPHGNAVGFDGSQMDGRDAIEKELTSIFSGHPTSRYVAKVREVRNLSESVQMLRAVVGMVPPDATSIKPDVNAIQTLIVAGHEGGWQIELFQNTPARFDGRPELARSLTDELNALVK
jgi:uncharacterized protein (TIGR02246 family)